MPTKAPSDAVILQAIRELEKINGLAPRPLAAKTADYLRILRWKASPECRELLKELDNADESAE